MKTVLALILTLLGTVAHAEHLDELMADRSMQFMIDTETIRDFQIEDGRTVRLYKQLAIYSGHPVQSSWHAVDCNRGTSIDLNSLGQRGIGPALSGSVFQEEPLDVVFTPAMVKHLRALTCEGRREHNAQADLQSWTVIAKTKGGDPIAFDPASVGTMTQGKPVIDENMGTTMPPTVWVTVNMRVGAGPTLPVGVDCTGGSWALFDLGYRKILAEFPVFARTASESDRAIYGRFCGGRPAG